MMDFQRQLKLQAYLDGELPEREAREVAVWLANDQDATQLLAELRNTRQAVSAANAAPRLLPESRDFYWSKIQREIERLEPARAEPVRVPSLVSLRRFFLPALATSAIVLGAFVVVRNLPGQVRPAETSFTDTSAFTYRDYALGATLVWLSYPADKEIADEPDDPTMH